MQAWIETYLKLFEDRFKFLRIQLLKKVLYYKGFLALTWNLSIKSENY